MHEQRRVDVAASGKCGWAARCGRGERSAFWHAGVDARSDESVRRGRWRTSASCRGWRRKHVCARAAIGTDVSGDRPAAARARWCAGVGAVVERRRRHHAHALRCADLHPAGPRRRRRNDEAGDRGCARRRDDHQQGQPTCPAAMEGGKRHGGDGQSEMSSASPSGSCAIEPGTTSMAFTGSSQ